MQLKSRKVACLGIVATDLIARPVESLPDSGMLHTVEQMELHSGGCASNTAIALTKLGGDVCIFGNTGDDILGSFLEYELRTRGVDVRGLLRKARCATSSSISLVDQDGKSGRLHHLGANALFTAEDLDFTIIKECAHLHIAGVPLMPRFEGSSAAEILQRARSHGIVTSLDMVWDPAGEWLTTLDPCLQHVDYFMSGLDEARQLSGLHHPEAILNFLLDRGPGTVILKLGEAGAMARTSQVRVSAPALPSQPVDTTGAGDCFAAGFLRGLQEGWELDRCLHLANAAGSLCIRAVGATTGIGTFEAAVSIMVTSDE